MRAPSHDVTPPAPQADAGGGTPLQAPKSTVESGAQSKAKTKDQNTMTTTTTTTTTTTDITPKVLEFTQETRDRLLKNECGRYTAIAYAAKEAAKKGATAKVFGAALHAVVLQLGCATAVYSGALTSAKSGASTENIVKTMLDLARKAADAQAKRRVNAAEKAARDKALKEAADTPVLSSDPVEMAQLRYDKACFAVGELERQVAAAQRERTAAETALAEAKAAKEASKEIAPVLAVAAEQAPLTSKEAETGIKERMAANRARMAAFRAAKELAKVPELMVANG